MGGGYPACPPHARSTPARSAPPPGGGPGRCRHRLPVADGGPGRFRRPTRGPARPVRARGSAGARVLRPADRHHRRRGQPDRPGLGQRRGRSRTRCSSSAAPPTGRAWADVTCRAVPRRGGRGRPRAGRRRHRAGRPGRPDEPHPLRVDPDRLRDLGRRRGHRADLRDLQRRAGRVDPRRLRRGRRAWWRPTRTPPWSPGSATGCPTCATSGRSTLGGVDELVAAGAAVDPAEIDAAPHGGPAPTTSPPSSTPAAPPAAPRAAC